ncbi:major facilitator transporter [Psychromicrobium lacuslunae]|uniref:Major facilitator transporter n=1 Tax=Psychromicrobium lacuslunae TaxID=1618207 RepID=A0A0D4C3E1_9MICC|nr:MFS transporter [Psychromicrobium lacuslunae]AJT43044.1 major facilitator transporter [Psychromicrobium lacuslunae]
MSASQPKSRVGLTVLALSLGTSLNPLNSSMIAVALVVLRGDFGLDVGTVTWVVTSFYLASAAGQPLMGRLADRFGPRRLFMLGMVIVALSCALAPLATNFLLVCLARALMAIGTATAFPSAVVMVRALSAVAKVSSTRPLSRIQMANTVGAALGPVVGGLLISVAGWQWLFLINVPLALISLLGVKFFAPADPPREQGSLGSLLKASDLPGIAAFTLTLVLLIMGLLDALPGYRGWLLGLAPLAAALFAWRELAVQRPFLDLRLLSRNRPLLLIYLAFLVFNGVYYVGFFGLPQLLEQSAGYPSNVVGLLMLPLAAISVVATPLAARAIDRFGVRSMLITGVLVLLLGVALLWLLTVSYAPPLVLLLTAALGLPFAAVNIAASQGMYASTPAKDSGVAAGILQTCRYIGAIAATVMIGVFYAPGVNQQQWSQLVLAIAGLAVLALVITLFWRPGRAETRSKL